MYIRTFVIYLVSILLIYFLPEMSSLLNVPLYLYEPLRIIIVVLMVHKSINHAYLLALLLPLISFLLSNHPSAAKTFILSGDLLLNIFLYFKLNKTYNNKFLSMSVSIVLCKLTYYLSKYLLIKFSLIEGSLIVTPIYIQIVIIIVLSSYVYLIDKLSPLKQMSGRTK